MRPGNLDQVRPSNDRGRMGNVYVLRGWIGIFSEGMNRLGDELNAAGVRTNVYQDDQWETLASRIQERYQGSRTREPLVLIGHSFGADDVLRVSRRLGQGGIMVDLVVTLDPVLPPDVPGNVRRCCNLYQSDPFWDRLPMFHGIALKPAAGSRVVLLNQDVRRNRTDLLEPGINHFNIEKKRKIHEEVLRQVLASCPPRTDRSSRASLEE